MSMRNRPIGVFDSGCGGLTVLQKLQEQLPHENFVYFADTINLPYGTKTPEQITCYTHAALDWLQHKAQVKLIVVACHTSSAVAIKSIQDRFKIPIIDMIHPLASYIVANAQHKKIGILATPASAASRMHATMLYQHGFTGYITSISCPDFVPLIEAPAYDEKALITVAQEYLAPFHTEALDTLIYGCTHYLLIASTIATLLPATMQYVNPANAIATAVVQTLQKHNLKTDLLNAGITHYYCTGDPTQFAAKVRAIMKEQKSNLKVV